MRRFSLFGFVAISIIGMAALTSCGEPDDGSDIRPGRVIHAATTGHLSSTSDFAAVPAAVVDIKAPISTRWMSAGYPSTAPVLAPEYMEAFLTDAQNFNPLRRRG